MSIVLVPDVTTVIVETPETITVQTSSNVVAVVDAAVQGPAGPPGPTGPPGSAGGEFIWDQPVAAAVWHIVHNLDKYPAVVVVDSSKRVVIGEVQYIDTTHVDVTFSAAFAGAAYLV